MSKIGCTNPNLSVKNGFISFLEDMSNLIEIDSIKRESEQHYMIFKVTELISDKPRARPQVPRVLALTFSSTLLPCR